MISRIIINCVSVVSMFSDFRSEGREKETSSPSLRLRVGPLGCRCCDVSMLEGVRRQFWLNQVCQPQHENRLFQLILKPFRHSRLRVLDLL